MLKHFFKSDQNKRSFKPDWLQTVVLNQGQFAHFKRRLLFHQNMNIISVSESSSLYFTGTRPEPCVCERLEDIDLCHALAIHPRLIHCQGSSSTVVFKTGRSIVHSDERWRQRPLNTPDWKVSTKSGRPFLNVALRASLSWYAHKDTLYYDATTPYTLYKTHTHTHSLALSYKALLTLSMCKTVRPLTVSISFRRLQWLASIWCN